MVGIEGLDKQLKNLFDTKTANKIARNALAKGARAVKSAIQSHVPSGQKEMRGAIGSRVGSGKGRGRTNGITTAKAGAAVGLKSTGERMSRGKGRPGVGIGARNIHWWILGTMDRYTGMQRKRRRLKSGKAAVVDAKATGNPRKYRGKMPPQKPIVRMGYSSGSSAAIAKIREGTVDGIIRELQRSGRA